MLGRWQREGARERRDKERGERQRNLGRGNQEEQQREEGGRGRARAQQPRGGEPDDLLQGEVLAQSPEDTHGRVRFRGQEGAQGEFDPTKFRSVMSPSSWFPLKAGRKATCGGAGIRAHCPTMRSSAAGVAARPTAHT